MRPFTGADLDHLVGLHGDAEVMAYMRSGAQSRAEVQAELDGYVATWSEHGYGIWALFDRETGDFVGECGLWLRDDGGGVALRCVIDRAHWSRGLAREASRAAVRAAFEEFSIDRVVAVSRADNIRSCRALEALGMHCERSFEQNGHALRFYVIERDDQRKRDS